MLYVNNEHSENKGKTSILITWKEVKSYQNMYRMCKLKMTKMFRKEFKT